MDTKASIQALNKFIVNNGDLQTLEKEIAEFNPLKILKIEEFETKHSNILAWLLAPNESHKLGDQIIKKVITEVLLNNDEIDIDFPEVPDIMLSNLYDLEIRREWENIDILAISKANQIVVLFENKINAKESKNQLAKYLTTVRTNFPGYRVLPIFLTKYGEDPKGSEEYCKLTHMVIHDIIKFALEMNSDSMNAKVVDFIQYYIKSLEGLFMVDEKLIELCKKIYVQHTEAIDLIVKHATSPGFSTAVDKFIEDNNDLLSLYSNNKLFVFIPKEFEKIVPAENMNTRDKYLIIYWFKERESKLQLTLQVGEFPDPDIRRNFMELLDRKGGFSIPKRAIEGQSKSTRIYSKQRNINDWDEVDAVVEAMHGLYQHDFKEINTKINASAEEFWLRQNRPV